MKRAFLIITIIMSFGINATTAQDFPELQGAYLGQKPPGIIPEVFAPNIVSDSTWAEHCQVAISPKGDEIFWSAWSSKYPKEDGTGNTEQIYYSKIENGIWTKPERADFIKENPYGLNGGPSFSRDGNKLFFYQVKTPWATSTMKTYYVEKKNGKLTTEIFFFLI